MPDSFEKRRRAQQKQRKRKDKLERRAQRQVEKQLGSGGSTFVYHTLRRGDNEHLAGAEVWLCALDLAAFHGWTPAADTRDAPEGFGSYTRPQGLTIVESDALSLAQSIDAELAELSDDEILLTDQAFGEEHTEELLSRRLSGGAVRPDEVEAARAILCGPLKRDAARLAEFLRGGAFTVML